MKIAFVGKGGSGKTTITALFARYLAGQNLPVLAIDADINQHLAVSLGTTQAQADKLPTMAEHAELIKEYLRGSNRRIASSKSVVKTTPPGRGSRLVTVAEANPIYEQIATMLDGVKLMAVGPITKADLGKACFHGKVGMVELLLGHMREADDEYVLVDMTAGADAFASGLFTKFDVSFLVAEPTRKGLVVYGQYKEHSSDYEVRLRVIGNKLEEPGDFDFLEAHVGGDLLASLSRSRYIKRMEQGHMAALDELEPENLKTLRLLKAAVDALEPGHQRQYRYGVDFHLLNARTWMNQRFGEDFTRQVDPEFSFN